MHPQAKNLIKEIDSLEEDLSLEVALGYRWATFLFVHSLEDLDQKLTMLQAHMKVSWLYQKALRK